MKLLSLFVLSVRLAFFALLVLRSNIIDVAGINIKQIITSMYSVASLSERSLWIPLDSNQTNMTIDRNKLPHNLTIISFINGIYHSEDDWERIVDQLSRTFDCPVRPFYNPSSGNWAADVSSASMQVIAKPNDFELAKNLSNHLRMLVNQIGEHGRVLHIAHSGGAILTYLAAKHHLTHHEREKIDVVTFGGGYSLTRKYFKGHLKNYYSHNDPCLYVDKRALQLSRRSSAFSLFGIAKNQTFNEVFDSKHNTSFVYMYGLTGNPIRDHSIEGPTYKIALELEARELIHRRNDLWKQLLKCKRRQNSKLRRFRKYCSRMTGLHHFFRINTKTLKQKWKDLKNIT